MLNVASDSGGKKKTDFLPSAQIYKALNYTKT